LRKEDFTNESEANSQVTAIVGDEIATSLFEGF
jgi:hypothetical protein